MVYRVGETTLLLTMTLSADGSLMGKLKPYGPTLPDERYETLILSVTTDISTPQRCTDSEQHPQSCNGVVVAQVDGPAGEWANDRRISRSARYLDWNPGGCGDVGIVSDEGHRSSLPELDLHGPQRPCGEAGCARSERDCSKWRG